jgi:hypothetical protein
MLVQDYVALPELFNEYKKADEMVSITPRSGRANSKYANNINKRYLVACFLANYLQERLCRAKPGKAVPFIGPSEVYKFCNELPNNKETRKNLANEDFVIARIKESMEFLEGCLR